MAVPYRSQYASPELIADIADGRIAGEQDPLWHFSGAADPREYALWARTGCGMACLQMLLAAHGLAVPTLVELGYGCEAYGGYRRAGERFDGLFYGPFVRFLDEQFGLRAAVCAPLSLDELTDQVDAGRAVLASVHKWIRHPDRPPPSRGGHLVLVHDHAGSSVCFHNPSGHTPATRADVWMSLEVFEPFFAGRGVSVALPTAAGADPAAS